MGSYKEIEISRSDAKNYSNVNDYGDKVTAKVYIGDDGKISEDSWSREKRESMKTEKKEDSSKKKQTVSKEKEEKKEKEAWYNTYCGKFLFTIILVLPIWWLING